LAYWYCTMYCGCDRDFRIALKLVLGLLTLRTVIL
jgi:hypothetical protein